MIRKTALGKSSHLTQSLRFHRGFDGLDACYADIAAVECRTVPDRGWAHIRSWLSLYHATNIQRFYWSSTLQKRPPMGRSGAARRRGAP
ncbi:hypothetical protein PEL8287_02372 [Roseovarius litorisediminis]|uniref:Uncharacterized protein n=1 Tax=Roseovarius litorisediminis TaxID=1312363 RepID=A0A1Y5SQ73_9RHOB|nr:hypothetical protein [Roseovarius litorisediminis]SLN45880.1 hypothetical protein PEL8287_02372 [Roseovarius litorisediminis]